MTADVPPLTNEDVSALFAEASATAEGHLARALRRASRRALEWPEEAAALVAAGRSLTDLHGIGPVLARTLAGWLADPPPLPPPDRTRTGFLSFAEVRAALDAAPEYRAARGDAQMHTTWSDGGASIEEMAAAGAAFGHDWIAITDHTKSLRIAGGMDEEQLAAQAAEVARLRTRGGQDTPKLAEILHAVEMNLDPEGRGDMDPGALARLDLVLGAFHSSLRDPSDQTERYLAALRNPDVHVLAHPRGRMYGRRFGLVADWDRVFAEAAALGKAVEVDAFPDRQDLDVGLLRRAAGAGAFVSIGSDAHHPGQLRYLAYGLGAAALAGVPTERIVNFWPAGQVRAWVGELRDRAGRRAGAVVYALPGQGNGKTEAVPQPRDQEEGGMETTASDTQFAVTIEDKLYPWSKPTITAGEIKELGGFPEASGVVKVDLVDGTEEELPDSEVHTLPRLEPGKGIVKRVAFRRA